MKYKSNYIEKINILPQEIQDKILDKVFVEHKLFLYSPHTKYELDEDLLDAHEERIDNFFNRIIDDKVPFALWEILKTLEDKISELSLYKELHFRENLNNIKIIKSEDIILSNNKILEKHTLIDGFYSTINSKKKKENFYINRHE